MTCTCTYEYHYVLFTKGAGQYWERGTAGACELTQTLLPDVGPATTLSVFLLPSSPYHQ